MCRVALEAAKPYIDRIIFLPISHQISYLIGTSFVAEVPTTLHTKLLQPFLRYIQVLKVSFNFFNFFFLFFVFSHLKLLFINKNAYLEHPSQHECIHWTLYICLPENFDRQSAAVTSWLYLVVINGQIEISRRVSNTEFNQLSME